MKIVKLKANAVKRLEAIGIEPDPDGGTVVVSGPNGNGKSSVLDSIFYALAGGRNIPDEPVKDGEETASVTVELGEDDTELVVTRTWTEGSDKNGRLKIEKPDGEKPDMSDQALLDSLIGDLTFDPSEFIRMTASEQRDELMRSVDLPIDMDDLEDEREEYYQERRDVKRDRDKLEGKLESMDEPSEDLPDEPVDVNNLSSEINDLNTRHNELKSVKKQIEDSAKELRSDLSRAEREIDKRNLDDHLDDLKSVTKPIIDDLKSMISETSEKLSEKRVQLESAQETNQAIRDAQDYRETKQEYEKLDERAEELTQKIQNLDDMKEQALEEVELPDPKLGFSDNGVTYDGKPFEQAATSEQIRAAVAIAMSLNPDLRIVRLKDGSFLDENNLELLNELAQEYDFQVWVEYVDTSGDKGIYIEDGTAQAVNNGHKTIE